MADEVATLIFKAESGDLVKAEAVLKRLEKQGNRTAKASDGLASGLKRAAVALLAFAGAAAGMRKLVSSARSFDILNAQLKTATGSAENAKIAFKAIENFAATTPFQLDEVTRAFVTMRNLGLDPSESALKSYGNTASALNRSLGDFINGVAKASFKNFEIIRDMGFIVEQQGDKVKFSFQGISKTVGNNSAEIVKYLQEIGNVNFAGAMDERAATLDGALSNLEDAWNSLWMSASQQGAGDEMARQIRDLADLLKDPETIKAAQTLANAIIKSFSAAASAISTTVNMVEWLGESLAAAIHGPAIGDLPRLQDALEDTRKKMAAVAAQQRRTTDPERLAWLDSLYKKHLDENTALKEKIELTNMLATLEKSPSKPAGGDVLGQFGVGGGDGDGEGDTPMTAARSRELERLRESFMTEQDLEKNHYIERMRTVADYYAQKQITEDEARAMAEQAWTEHQQKLKDIQLEAENEKTEGFRNTLSIAEQYYAGLEGKEAAHARAVLQGMKILSDAKKRDALKTATIEGYKGIQVAASSLPFPANLIPIAFATAQMAGNIAGITSARALGGQVMPDSPYLVGERGPELFVPGSQGNIVTNERLRGGGGEQQQAQPVNIGFTIQALDGSNVEQVLMDQRGFIFSMINEAVNDQGRGALV